MTGVCAYCRSRRAVGRDHVIPKSLAKRLKHRGVEITVELLVTVPACLECNVRKGTRKLVPPKWESKIRQLKEVVPGKWRVWMGGSR